MLLPFVQAATVAALVMHPTPCLPLYIYGTTTAAAAATLGPLLPALLVFAFVWDRVVRWGRTTSLALPPLTRLLSLALWPKKASPCISLRGWPKQHPLSSRCAQWAWHAPTRIWRYFNFGVWMQHSLRTVLNLLLHFYRSSCLLPPVGSKRSYVSLVHRHQLRSVTREDRQELCPGSPFFDASRCLRFDVSIGVVPSSR